MLLTSQQLKENAKARLKGNWGGAICVILISGGITYAASMLVSMLTGMGSSYNYNDLYDMMDYMDNYDYMYYALESMLRSMRYSQMLNYLVSIFVSVPLMFGMQRWYYRLVRGYRPEIGDIFYYFTSGKRYGSVLAFHFNMYFRELGLGIVVMLIPVVLLIVGIFIESVTLAIVGSVAFLLSGVIYVYLLSRYAIAFMQFNDYEGITSTEAINRSISTTKPYRSEIFQVHLSFLPLWILAVASFVVPLVMLFVGIGTENIGLGLMGGILFFVGIIAYIILIPYTSIYSAVTYMEMAANISDMAYGNPVQHQQMQYGAPMQVGYQPPMPPQGGYQAPMPPQGGYQQPQQQGYQQTNYQPIPSTPPLPPQGPPPAVPYQPPVAPPQQQPQPLVVYPQPTNTVQSPPPTLETSHEVIGEAIETPPEISTEFQGAQGISSEVDNSRPELNHNFDPIEKEEPIYDAQVPEAPQPPSINDLNKEGNPL